MNPRAYIKRHDENIKSNQKKIAIANSMEIDKSNTKKSGRKTKQEKEVETRMKQQAAFLLFLEKEKDSPNKEE